MHDTPRIYHQKMCAFPFNIHTKNREKKIEIKKKTKESIESEKKISY